MSWEQAIFLSCGALVCAVCYTLCSPTLFGILQQEEYHSRALYKWYFRRGNLLFRRYSLLAVILFLLVALFNLTFSFAGVRLTNLISVLPFVGGCMLFRFSDTRALKVPVVYTNRMKRLIGCYAVLLAALSFGVETGLFFAAEAIGHSLAGVFRFVPVTLLPLLFPILLATANFFMKGFELPRNHRFIVKATKKLAGSDCIKVGITGSYAKTSVKHMASAVLSRKFSVVATPASFNTPIGIARAIDEGGLDCEVYLAEMGARKEGDIAELCDMVRPDYAIVTGVCCQHLESFGSLEAIVREKSVLARRAPKGCVLGKSCVGMREDAVKEGVDFAAEDVICTAEDTRFTLRLKEERIPVKTSLLGAHAAQDIALAAALAHMLGMTAQEIAEGIDLIEPIPHRLQKLTGGNGVHILDDSYNSNVEGAKDAVATLRLFGGKKYVVTPGLVELGQLEEKENGALGALFVGLDGIILVGQTLVLSVREGYLKAGGDDGKLRVVSTLKKAQELIAEELSAGDCVLFLNDLPDKYLRG